MTTDSTVTGVRCVNCAYVSLPVQSFGCERCGYEVKETALSGRGVVLTAVTVHEHPDPALVTPAFVGSVQLVDGPVLRARLDGALAAGTTVQAAYDDSVLRFGRIGSEG